MSLLDKARVVTGNAAQKANELKEQAAERASSLSDQTKGLASDVRDRATALSSELADATMDRAKAAMSDLNAALPLLKRAGYSLKEVTLQIGVTPKIAAVFTLNETVSDAHMQELLAENPDAKLATMLLRTLASTSKLQAAIHIGGLRSTGIAVDIGFPPSVYVKFES